MAVAQEDLATLFAKNLTLSSAVRPPPTPPQEEALMTDEPNKIVYISQHYTHSAHIAPVPQQQPERPSSEPPRTNLADLELLLRQHGVDTAALSHPQVELFRAADDAQKARLIQLWTICPPSPADNPTLTWSTTTLEQEEILAHRRYEASQEAVPEMDMDSPGAQQSDDGRWLPQQQQQQQQHYYVEPYMASGYEELARREYEASARKVEDGYKTSVDPVYKSTSGMLDWERQQWMENQYGSFCYSRDEEML